MITLMTPTLRDEMLLWQFRNDVAIRRELGLKAISYAECLDWASRMSDMLFLVHDDKLGDVGFVAFEDIGDDRLIMVGIGSVFRGKGYGKQAIRLATENGIGKGKRLKANIRSENYKALFAFESAGYKEALTVKDGPHEYFVFEYANAKI